MKLMRDEVNYWEFPAVLSRTVCSEKRFPGYTTATIAWLGGSITRRFRSDAQAKKWASEHVVKEYRPMSYFLRFGTACE